jgi:hypothetical protein
MTLVRLNYAASRSIIQKLSMLKKQAIGRGACDILARHLREEQATSQLVAEWLETLVLQPSD